MNIIFMGSPTFSTPTLKSLINEGYNIVSVYTQPPRVSGRGKKVQITPVHELATEYGIEVRTPEKLKNNTDEIDFIKNSKVDAIVVVAYGIILPVEILDIPKLGCINVHASLLPEWRGASPIHASILHGDKESGITIIQMDSGVDTGDILHSNSLPILENETTSSLHDKLAQLGASTLIETLSTDLKPVKQHYIGKYAPIIKKEDGKIDWSKSCQEIDRHVRAYSAWPGAYFILNDETYKIHSGYPIIDEHSIDPGKTINDGLLISCGSGYYQITTIQKQGKNVLPIKQFLNGNKISSGVFLK